MSGSAAWVGIAAVMHLFLAFHLVSEERARSENLLTSDNNDSLAIEQLLGYNACKATQQVIAAVNDNLFFEHA